MVRLVGDGVVVELAPESGGAVARYDVDLAGEWRPVLLASTDSGRAGPFALASNVLAPWSNRISGGGFSYGGQFHALEPNIAGEPYPNHGNAFASAWDVAGASESQAVFTLHSDGPGPFRYDARLTYALDGAALRMSLSLTNRAAIVAARPCSGQSMRAAPLHPVHALLSQRCGRRGDAAKSQSGWAAVSSQRSGR